MFCQTCYEEKNPDPVKYFFEFTQINLHSTHKFESLHQFKESRLTSLIHFEVKERQEYFQKNVPEQFLQIMKQFKAKIEYEIKDYMSTLVYKPDDKEFTLQQARELMNKFGKKDEVKVKVEKLFQRMRDVCENFNLKEEVQIKKQSAYENIYKGFGYDNVDLLDIDDLFSEKQKVNNHHNDKEEGEISFFLNENDIEGQQQHNQQQIIAVKRESDDNNQGNGFNQLDEMPYFKEKQVQQRQSSINQQSDNNNQQLHLNILSPFKQQYQVQQQPIANQHEVNQFQMNNQLHQQDYSNQSPIFQNILQKRQERPQEQLQIMQEVQKRQKTDQKQINQQRIDEEEKVPFQNNQDQYIHHQMHQNSQHMMIQNKKISQDNSESIGQQHPQLSKLLLKEEMAFSCTAVKHLHQINLIAYSDKNGHFLIQNTNTKDFVIEKDLSALEEVISIIQTMPERGQRIYLLTKSLIYSFSIGQDRNNMHLYNCKSISVDATNMIDFLYFFNGQTDLMYILDKNKIIVYYPSENKSRVIFKYSECDLTCFIGRKSDTTIYLYLGDSYGRIHVLDTVRHEILMTYNIFTSESSNLSRENRIQQMQMVRDNQCGFYIVATQYLKCKVAVINESDSANPISYFKFEDKVIRIFTNKNLKNNLESSQQYLMVLTEKSLEIMDYIYLQVSQELGYFKNYTFKYSLGEPENNHITVVNGVTKNLVLLLNKDKYFFTFNTNQQTKK